MSIVVSEKYRGRRMDAASAEVVYLVVGDGADAGTVMDDDAFNAVASAAPSTWNGLASSNIDVRSELIQGTIWEVAAIYGTSEQTVYQQSTTEYEFSYQAPSEKIYQSLSTRGVYSANGPINSNKFGGAVNVKNDNGELTVEGVDLPAGSPTNTWIYKPLHANVTTAYQLSVEALMGAVNLYTFMGRPARTIRVVSVDGGAVFAAGINPKWAIRFGFQYSANRSNFVVDEITIPFKGGHEVLWGYYEDVFDAAPANVADHGLVKRPKFLVVDQVFPEADFSVLGIS